MNFNKHSQLSIEETNGDISYPSNSNVVLQSIKERKIFRLMYYFCLFVLCTVLVVQLQKAIQYFLSYPTYTKSHLVRQSEAEFPALSICSDTSNFNETVLQVKIDLFRNCNIDKKDKQILSEIRLKLILEFRKRKTQNA